MHQLAKPVAYTNVSTTKEAYNTNTVAGQEVGHPDQWAILLNEGTFIQDTMFHGCLHGRQIPIEELDQGRVMAISKNMPDHQNQSQNGSFLIYSNMQI